MANGVLKFKFKYKVLLLLSTSNKPVSDSRWGWEVWCGACWSSSDLLQQVGGEEAKLPSCTDLQVAVYLLTLLHHNLRTHTTNTLRLGTFLNIFCKCRLCFVRVFCVIWECAVAERRTSLNGKNKDVPVKHVWSLWCHYMWANCRANCKISLITYCISTMQVRQNKIHWIWPWSEVSSPTILKTDHVVVK